jgi:alpha-tubulin suppressor-like RCC1 family protein
VLCWGSNAYLELAPGDLGTNPSASPIMSTFQGMDSLSLGDEFGCGLRQDATIECAGKDEDGQLGNSNTIFPLANAMPVPGAVFHNNGVLLDVAQVAAGRAHTCARLISGEVDCWGANTSGQLGSGAVTPVVLPVPVIW